ncbi:MAG TPA: glycosyltransferase family 4 protein [Terriglobales bacterium]|nr:glycosyltransferase family 4 protein [Terriglobales bacterium]
MLTVAYIANQFPSPMEPYVWQEIGELRRRGTRVIASSVRKADAGLDEELQRWEGETFYLQPFSTLLLPRAAWTCLRKPYLLANLSLRDWESEPPGRRLRALVHTWLGAHYALMLEGRGVRHIHAHHGYSAAWIAMTAARLLGVSFSMTLHGSDLLLHHAFLGTKLARCKFCLTVSEFNRRHLIEHYPGINAGKIFVSRLGVDAVAPDLDSEMKSAASPLLMLAVGRLHAVKDHAFLIRGCGELKRRGLRFACLIAGEGPERAALSRLIHDLGLREEVRLLGHLSRQRLEAHYAMCDLVVLTSRSEGLPLVLMEAMAHSRTVLAPGITGIPELITDGKTGFVYQPGSISSFAACVERIAGLQALLAPLRQAARRHVFEHFNRERNLAEFAELFLTQASALEETVPHEDSVLQQI